MLEQARGAAVNEMMAGKIVKWGGDSDSGVGDSTRKIDQTGYASGIDQWGGAQRWKLR